MFFSFSPEALIASGVVHEDWLPALEKSRKELSDLELFLTRETQAGHRVLPDSENIFKALQQSPHEVRVVIVGQDPYPTAGNAMGLAFSVTPETRPLPGSLRNIFTELVNDIGCSVPANGDLSAWAKQGVLLLNRVLTVREDQPGSHRNKGWEAVTQYVLEHLDSMQEKGLVALLWGRDAQSAAPYLGNAHIIESSHPSPLSAHRGFLGSRPFSQANEKLLKNGLSPIHWCLV